VLYPFGDLPDSLSPCENIPLQGTKMNRTGILKEQALEYERLISEPFNIKRRQA
jgi:hypothetical protein